MPSLLALPPSLGSHIKTILRPWLAVCLLLLARSLPAAVPTSPAPGAVSPAAFVQALAAGQPQTVVTYGTSLTAGGAWVAQLKQALDQRFPRLVTVINSGQGGMWSKWGVDNLDARVISKKPDAVFIEFAINDAFLKYETHPADARKNLETMIDRAAQVRNHSHGDEPAHGRASRTPP